jgi:hypothetical protein
MKKFFLFMGILAFNRCYAATGSASDGELAFLSVILLLVLPVATIYFFDFLKSRINDIRTRRMHKKNMTVHN